MLKFSSRLWPYIIAAACAAAPFPTARVARADHVVELGGGAYRYTYGRRFHSAYANPSAKADYMAADGLVARPTWDRGHGGRRWYLYRDIAV